MPDPASYLVFLAASGAIILVPGPAQALVLARTISDGRRAGALTAVGLNVGTLFHSSAAALGLSAVLATSALAFSVVKYVGAAYLVFLGARALRSGVQIQVGAAGVMRSTRSVVAQAVTAGVLNPKVALFFLAFLPQFVDPARGPVFVQFLALGATMAALDTLYELALVHLVSAARGRYAGNSRLVALQSKISGGVLIGLGLRLAVQQR